MRWHGLAIFLAVATAMDTVAQSAMPKYCYKIMACDTSLGQPKAIDLSAAQPSQHTAAGAACNIYRLGEGLRWPQLFPPPWKMGWSPAWKFRPTRALEISNPISSFGYYEKPLHYGAGLSDEKVRLANLGIGVFYQATITNTTKHKIIAYAAVSRIKHLPVAKLMQSIAMLLLVGGASWSCSGSCRFHSIIGSSRLHATKGLPISFSININRGHVAIATAAPTTPAERSLWECITTRIVIPGATSSRPN